MGDARTDEDGSQLLHTLMLEQGQLERLVLRMRLLDPELEFWPLHLEELARRLHRHLAHEQTDVLHEARRRLAGAQLEALDERFRSVRQETLELLEHGPIEWRALLAPARRRSLA